ncbi:hydrogenase maturation protein HypF [Catenulispora sp. GP43]|uniref:carbamoyltransferase HypF n=1 Tax=Catenulispora sp. GP43 TaxID=3156263 RepID=UPI0035144D1E
MSSDVDSPPAAAAAARHWQVRGTVQGVGFRPFAHRLATELGLSGSVRNRAGVVEIDAFGPPEALAEFRTRLSAEAPPLAAITAIVESRPGVAAPPEAAAGFTIQASADLGGDGRAPAEVAPAEIPPDAGLCDACRAEVLDPADRRHRYPFTNCTACGPRATIIDDLPYDRARTSMAGFPLCPRCRAEYLDPADRRFHAEPIACPECGPQAAWYSRPGFPDVSEAVGETALSLAAQRLAAGGVIAVKGLGGYQLVCDATDPGAVARLREIKHRPDKPFAVMVPDLAAVRALACVTRTEENLLAGAARPIVLVRPWPVGVPALAPGVAPDAPRLGLFLPTTALHLLLLLEAGRPLVVTSGNTADAPIIVDDRIAAGTLAPVCDGVLAHDRPIRARYDDSVARAVHERTTVIRRARGFAPAALGLPIASPEPLLAVGAHLKHTFTLAIGARAFVGPHTGDLSDLAALEAFDEAAEHMQRVHRVRPETVVHDLHPEYLSTKIAAAIGNPDRRIAVQHHHAHIASCAAEHGITDPVLGVAYDGLGLGADGTLWGGEVLLADLRGFRRLARFGTAPMPGGEAAVRHPLRMALGYLAGGEDLGGRRPDPATVAAALAGIADREPKYDTVLRLALSGTGSPRASSAGRLFDAASALLGLCDHVSYEGQAAVTLEAASQGVLADPLPWRIVERDGLWVLDCMTTLTALLTHRLEGAEIPELAAAFHEALALATADLVHKCAADTGVRTVCLSGGVWQNNRLTEAVAAGLEGEGYRVLINQRVPCNDGGISFGQAAIAAARLAER